MSTPLASSVAEEINRLHALVMQLTAKSRHALSGSLAAAWRAGQLLTAEKKRVRRAMGGAWILWLKSNFHGSVRTAQRYMLLAAGIEDPAFLRGLSIRQAYLRLGIATEPKSRAESPQVPLLPEPIRLASRLLQALRADAGDSDHPDKSPIYRDDLRVLYNELRQLFEPANQLPGAGSNHQCASLLPLRDSRRICAG